MLTSRSMTRVFVGAVIASLCGVASLAAAQDTSKPTSGKLTGILVQKESGKTNAFILVKPEGADESTKYIPKWVAATAQKDAQFNPEMVEAIKKAAVSNLVEIEWTTDEHLRVTSLKVIVPEPKEGKIEGVVMAKGEGKGENWIDVKPANGPTERYLPRWVEGGNDKEIVTKFAKLNKGDAVRITYKYEERKRALGVTKVTAEPK